MYRKDQDISGTINLNNDNDALHMVEKGTLEALKTYSNVHRGSGHFSMITTELFENARKIILDYLELDWKKYQVIFCSTYGAELLETTLKKNDYYKVKSSEIGLPIGVSALVIQKRQLHRIVPVQTGGNVVKMVSPDSVIWADVPNKFEAGTPAIINIIMFAIALRAKKKFSMEYLVPSKPEPIPVQSILYDDELTKYSGYQLLEELQKLQIGYDSVVSVVGGTKKFVNFDHAASTPTFTPVWNAVKAILRQPETIYSDLSLEVKHIIAEFINADSALYETIFTLNTTEAINIVSRFIHDEFGSNRNTVIVNTILEHNSNVLPWRFGVNATLLTLTVDKNGFINIDTLESLLKEYNKQCAFGEKRIRLLTISGASNVMGTINDIAAVCNIAHKYNVRVLVDGAQLVAHRAVNITKCGVDYFTFSGHKIYAPFGTGVLLIRKEYVRDGNLLKMIQKSGDENIIGIASLGKSLVLLQRIGMNTIEQVEYNLIKKLLAGLSTVQGIKVYGITDCKLENSNKRVGVISFSVEKPLQDKVAKALAEHGGIGVRYGCFCAHLLVKHLFGMNSVQVLMVNLFIILLSKITGITPLGLVRVSTGIDNDINDADRLIEVLKKISGTPGRKLHHDINEMNIQSSIQQKVKMVYLV